MRVAILEDIMSEAFKERMCNIIAFEEINICKNRDEIKFSI